MNAIAPGLRAARRQDRSQIYLAAGVVATLIAFIGFWPTYFGPLLQGSVEATLLVHVHAVVQVAWLALFIAQIVLASTGHLRLHMRVGRWTMAYSIVVIVVGLMLAFDTAGRTVALGDAVRGQRQLFGLLREILFIVPFIAAGWIYRDRPETHKRLMMVAAVMLLVPAVGRMRYLFGENLGLWQFMLVWPLPVYLLMLHDFAKKRLVHPVYLIGVAAMLMERLVLPLRDTATWLAMSEWFVPFYQTSAN